MLVTFNSQNVTLKCGEGIYLPGYVIHSFKTISNSECHIWEFDSAFTEEKISNKIQTFKIPIEAICFFKNINSSPDDYIKKSEIYFIFSCIHSNFSRKYDLKNDDIISKTCFYIAENYNDFITLNDAANFAGVSPTYLSKIFKDSMGISFCSCLNTTRIDSAMNMLKYGTNTVTQIAMLCGFGSLRNFNRFFKSIIGCTPSEYRKKSKEK